MASISTTLEPASAMSSTYDADWKITRRGSRSSVAFSASVFVCETPYTIQYDGGEVLMSNRNLGLMILYTISLYDVVCARTLTAFGRPILYSMILPFADSMILCVYDG